jgi:tRNA threonylcarbamoyl adenosine modification protein YeaZ
MREETPMSELVLGIDTSTRVCVGLARDQEPVASVSTGDSRSHVELLMPTIQQVLAGAGVTAEDLTSVVVGMGPGPYTGLRVGVVAAEMIGVAQGLAVRHVCSLDVLAIGWARTHPQSDFIACTDARRHELYWAVYDRYGQRLEGPLVSGPDDLPNLASIGPGTLLYPQAGGGMDSFLALKLGLRVDGLASGWPKLEDVSDIVGLDAGLMAAWAEQLPEVGPEPLYLRHADATEPTGAKSVLPQAMVTSDTQHAHSPAGRR